MREYSSTCAATGHRQFRLSDRRGTRTARANNRKESRPRYTCAAPARLPPSLLRSFGGQVAAVGCRRASERTGLPAVARVVIAARERRLARPAGLEPATPGLEVPRKEATGGSVKPLPLILLPFCQTPDHPRLPRAATYCQSFVSRLSPLEETPLSVDAEPNGGLHGFRST